MRDYYKLEHEMPQVNIHSPKNLNQIVNLSNVLLHFNNESFERSTIFVQAIITVASLQFLYICLEIIVRKQLLTDVASMLFIGYATFDFFVIMGYFFIILNYGSQANATDFEIKELMVELSKDCSETKQLCDDGRIWARK